MNQGNIVPEPIEKPHGRASPQFMFAITYLRGTTRRVLATLFCTITLCNIYIISTHYQNLTRKTMVMLGLTKNLGI